MNNLFAPKKYKGITGLILLVLGLLFYNHKRNHATYNFDLSSRSLSINLIPFYNFSETIELLGANMLLKFLFFCIIGILLYYLLYNFDRLNPRFFCICALIIVFHVDFLQYLTSGLTLIRGQTSVVIDINNWMLYFSGCMVGYLLGKIILTCIHNIYKYILRKIYYSNNWYNIL